MTLTVGDVWVRIKQRTDLEKAGSTGFVSDAEGIKMVQLGTAQLQNLVMNTYEYWLTRYKTFTTVVNQLSYPFDSIGMRDFYKLLGIGIITNTSSPQDSWMPLEHFHIMDMGLPLGGFFQFNNSFSVGMRYAIMSSDKGVPQLELRAVKSVQTVGVYYVPRPPEFSALADEFPGWIMPGWEEYIVAFGAWMLGIKEKSGTASHKEVWMMISDQIKNFAPNRDSFQAATVTSIVGGTPWWLYRGYDAFY